MADHLSAVVLAFGPDVILERALLALSRQTRPPDEIIVVHSNRDEALPQRRADAAGGEARTSFLFVPFQTSPGAARNAGVRASHGRAFVVVDGSEEPAAGYFEAAFDAVDAVSTPAFVTAPMSLPASDRATGCAATQGTSPLSLAQLLTSPFALSAASLVSRAAFERQGGFDEALPGLTDWDLLISLLEAEERGAILGAPLTRWASDNLPPGRVLRPERHLPAVRLVFLKHQSSFARHSAAVLAGRERVAKMLWLRERDLVDRRDRLRSALDTAARELEELRAALQPYGRASTEWGDLRRPAPVSRYWGLDRGRPIDRHYIEGFLARHAADIRGDVLEVLDAGLTTMFGGEKVQRSDVLDIDEDNLRATVLADLRAADAVPCESYDCFILTQTLHLIDDVPAALAHARRILRPGGVLLATLPAVSMVAPEGGPRGDYWRVTAAGARRFFETAFASDELEIVSHGNVLGATAFLYGLSCEEVDPGELDVDDPAYPVVITVRAVKRAARPRRGTLPPRPSAILLYHRVASLGHDMHGLAVSPEEFRAQLESLARNWRLVPLADLAAAAARGSALEGAVALTFDDGYVDNLEAALPILTAFDAPATFFLTSEDNARPTAFWWDVLAAALLGDRTPPPSLALRIDGRCRQFATANATERQASHDGLYRLFKGAPPVVRDDLLRQLSRATGVPPAMDTSRRMSADEIRQLAASPLAEIGAHGAHHLALPTLPPDQTFREVFEGRSGIERIIGRAVLAFAYPYGDVSPPSIEMVRAAGYSAAVTCEPRPLRSREEPMTLPRLQAPSRVGSSVSEWLTASCVSVPRTR